MRKSKSSLWSRDSKQSASGKPGAVQFFARTIGEIGERLTEYTSVAKEGDRTPIQRHLDRIAFLKANPGALSALTSNSVERIHIRSALVTDYLVPMQFSKRALGLVNLVTDLALLHEAFG